MILRGFLVEAAAVVLLALGGYWLWDRHRYRGSGRESPTLQRTDEVFLDPATGRRVRVYFDPATGGRVYRNEAEEAPDPRGPAVP